MCRKSGINIRERLEYKSYKSKHLGIVKRGEGRGNGEGRGGRGEYIGDGRGEEGGTLG